MDLSLLIYTANGNNEIKPSTNISASRVCNINKSEIKCYKKIKLLNKTNSDIDQFDKEKYMCIRTVN